MRERELQREHEARTASERERKRRETKRLLSSAKAEISGEPPVDPESCWGGEGAGTSGTHADGIA